MEKYIVLCAPFRDCPLKGMSVYRKDRSFMELGVHARGFII